MGTIICVVLAWEVVSLLGAIMKGLVLALVLGLFSASYAKVYLEETFSDGDNWSSRWVKSAHSGKEFGEFERTAGKFYSSEEYSQGIKTSQDARFYGISTKVDEFSNKDGVLVIQFSVKHEQNIDCGGGYIKLFGSDLTPTDMHGESPYAIMFGPDICGPGTKKVHVIFSYKGENKLIKEDIRCKDDVLSHMYTLIVRPDNTYEVRIDNDKVKDGNLEDHFDFLAPKTIKDPEAKKPEDWDDKPKIDDPEDKKPEDWDQPEHIADPDAKKPEDWDDDMDGEWEAPMIDNPEYKGEWTPKQIDNPNYKGEWVHPMIDNPAYEPDDKLYAYDSIAHLGLDLWQVKSGSIFDNFLVTDDLEYAEKKAVEFNTHKDPEQKMKDEQDEAERKEAEALAAAKDDDEDKDDEDDSDEEDDIIPDDEPSIEESAGHEEL